MEISYNTETGLIKVGWKNNPTIEDFEKMQDIHLRLEDSLIEEVRKIDTVTHGAASIPTNS